LSIIAHACALVSGTSRPRTTSVLANAGFRADSTTGPKVIVITGDANEAPVFIRALMPAWEHNRYALALIDQPSLSF
jgi:hypothetical protein